MNEPVLYAEQAQQSFSDKRIFILLLNVTILDVDTYRQKGRISHTFFYYNNYAIGCRIFIFC
jgi:hypothetical protein